MMKIDSQSELYAALESIQKEQYPEIPSDLLESIIRIENDNQDNRAEAASKVSKLIEDFLTQEMK